MINVSVVLYHNPKGKVLRAIRSCLTSKLVSKLYLVDNSSNANLTELANIDSRVVYIINNANLGYGRAHNMALRETLKEEVKYHLVLNPDVYFGIGVLERLYEFMESELDVGLIIPKVLYPDGTIQYVCKLLPTPTDLLGRRFLNIPPFRKYIERRNEIYELRFTGYNHIMEVPFISGCFMFIRTEILKEIGLFDERFFMYMEDLDLSRRIYRKSKVIFYPYVCIYHEYSKGSYKEKKLLKYHIASAVKYFNKWGWFVDPERDIINREVLKKLRYRNI